MSRYLYDALFILFLFTATAGAEDVLPAGPEPAPVVFPHFPDRLHAFVWRNWPVVEAERLAKVLGTEPERVCEIAESMGLPPQQPVPAADRNRIYITLIRRNWHLLPYAQLLTLLEMSAEEMAHSLREDDFLFIKLGSLKPKCEPLVYAPPSESARRRAAEIKKIVAETFADAWKRPAEPRLAFVDELTRKPPSGGRKEAPGAARFSPRYIYSYFALYGDPLLHPEMDPYPEGLLQRLADLGVDGVWIHTVLRHLAPSGTYPEFGEDCETRLKNLRALVNRAAQFGLGVYLYVNEPRAMPEAFFADRADIRGVKEGAYCAMCTSTPEVRDWLTDSLEYVFKNVPGLAGAFTITASENLTNCASHRGQKNCPRCKKRSAAEIIAEVNSAIEAGVHRGNPNAHAIAWDWGWSDEWAADAIARLPKSCWLMSVSEWSKPIERGGVKTTVGEYSISVVGPGPRAAKHWRLASEAGLKTIAKVQVNATWELSAVPFLPVLDLVAEHCQNLLTSGVDGLMLSWTVGGYPSPNLRLLREFDGEPPPSKETALDAVARTYFGSQAAPKAREAWTAFSDAFREFPYHGGVLYQAPLQTGPSNLLYTEPTDYIATMVGIPYDDVDRWRGPYPADVFAGQLEKIVDGWQQGIMTLSDAISSVPSERRQEALAQLRYAKAGRLHFASVANQTRFTAARNEVLDAEARLSSTDIQERKSRMAALLRSEIEIARELYPLAREDSRVGFEASNQYYYLPVDLMEKVINCRYIADNLDMLFPQE